jgi:hypothetical protein
VTPLATNHLEPALVSFSVANTAQTWPVLSGTGSTTSR